MTIKIIKKGNTKPVVRVVKRAPTLKQEKVIKLTKEALEGKGGKSKGGILREAGYSDKIVDNPQRVFDSPVVKDALEPVIKKMRDIRVKVLDALDQKEFTKESAFNLTMIAGMLTKDSELLDGRPTSRDEHELPPEEKARLDKMLKLNS